MLALQSQKCGSWVNPALAFLRRFPVKIEDGQVLVDVGAPAA